MRYIKSSYSSNICDDQIYMTNAIFGPHLNSVDHKSNFEIYIHVKSLYGFII